MWYLLVNTAHIICEHESTNCSGDHRPEVEALVLLHCRCAVAVVVCTVAARLLLNPEEVWVLYRPVS